MGNSELIELTTRGNYTLKGKPGHRVMALKKGSFVPKWTSLSNIHIQATSTYYLPLKIGSNVFNNEATLIDYSGNKLDSISTSGMAAASMPASSSEELAYLLGYLVSEEHTKDNYIVVTNKNKQLIDHLAQCYADVFDLSFEEVEKRIITKTDGFFEFRVYDSFVTQILSYVGLAHVPSHEKSVPWIIRQGTKEEQTAFLAALFEGDGSAAQAREVSYYSLSDKLLTEVQQMLLNFGIYAKRTLAKIVWSTTDDTASTPGSLYLSGKNSLAFAENIGFVFDRNQNKIHTDKTHSHNNLVDVLPKILSWSHQGKFKDYVESLKGGNENFRLEDFDDWHNEANGYANTLTNVSRIKFLAELKALKKFIDYTKTNNLIWLEVEGIKFNFEKSPTFDLL
jgi:hypothetical protein